MLAVSLDLHATSYTVYELSPSVADKLIKNLQASNFFLSFSAKMYFKYVDNLTAEAHDKIFDE